jgi:hypothetical protein
MQITTSLYDARWKQVYEWHIQILHIFLNNFHIKYVSFRVTDWKIWIKQNLHICSNFQGKKTENWAGPEAWLATDNGCRAPATGREILMGWGPVGAGWGWRAGTRCQIGSAKSGDFIPQNHDSNSGCVGWIQRNRPLCYSFEFEQKRKPGFILSRDGYVTWRNWKSEHSQRRWRHAWTSRLCTGPMK